MFRRNAATVRHRLAVVTGGDRRSNGGRNGVRRSRLTGSAVRAMRFLPRRWRRGLDPDEVHGYLERVADEIDELHRELRMAWTEADRVRNALREWQSERFEAQFDQQRQVNGQHRYASAR
jgi:DivIVA domain-containing protein